MLKIYRLFKIIAGTIILLFIIAVVFYESTRENPSLYSEIKEVKGIENFYLSIKGFIFYDPYYTEITEEVDKSQKEFVNIFLTNMQNFSNLIQDKKFYNAIFISFLSNKITGIDNLIKQYLENAPGFRDFLILDKKKNILYQYGKTTYIPVNESGDSTIMRFVSNSFQIIENYKNPIDYEIKVVALFDKEEIIKKIKNIKFKTFFLTEQELYKNSEIESDIIQSVISETTNKKKIEQGGTIIEIFPVVISQNYIGSLGIIYPSRSPKSIIIVISKLFLILLAIGILIISDRLIEKLIKKVKEIQERKRKEKMEIENPDIEGTINWIENYIQKTEEKK